MQSQFHQCRNSRLDIERIRKVVLNILKLKTINELRDRLDGISFYKEYSNKISSLLALEKMLNTKFINWENLNSKKFNPYIALAGVKIDIISSNYGLFPIIDSISKRPAIIALRKDENTVLICGYASSKVLNEFQNDRFVEQMRKLENKGAFVGFDKLIKFKDIEDLKQIIKNEK